MKLSSLRYNILECYNFLYSTQEVLDSIICSIGLRDMATYVHILERSSDSGYTLGNKGNTKISTKQVAFPFS